MPALRASRPTSASSLKESSAADHGRGRAAGCGRLLVVGQVGVVGACCSSARRCSPAASRARSSIDPGFSLRHGLLASIDLLPDGYDEARGDCVLSATAASASRALPGVEAATSRPTMPLDIGAGSDMSVHGGRLSRRATGEEVMAYYNQVGPGVLRDDGRSLVQGRGDRRRGRRRQPAVVVINETMARRYLAGARSDRRRRSGSAAAR